MPDAYGTISPGPAHLYTGDFRVKGNSYTLQMDMGYPPELSCSNAKLTYDSIDQLAGSKEIQGRFVKDDELELNIYGRTGNDITITGSLDNPVSEELEEEKEEGLIGHGDWSHKTWTD
ncbi:hypothetical protein ASPBRDRAFT_70344 [Aspergillus brasiliensis CBS 101740]|uniref:Uncharacterized protein n=1 Tax=Aspergillus brasiliensis (strain CBS 101740 / IMI 381727 / IBT 21946) TaxID=767769 RepID=A0A1L9U1P4_ASPBC|nr:hypothetical protein ASPBRDRAFT_70344 [Aspergillus brasiliensis CBS 101740]